MAYLFEHAVSGEKPAGNTVRRYIKEDVARSLKDASSELRRAMEPTRVVIGGKMYSLRVLTGLAVDKWTSGNGRNYLVSAFTRASLGRETVVEASRDGRVAALAATHGAVPRRWPDDGHPWTRARTIGDAIAQINARDIDIIMDPDEIAEETARLTAEERARRARSRRGGGGGGGGAGGGGGGGGGAEDPMTTATRVLLAALQEEIAGYEAFMGARTPNLYGDRFTTSPRGRWWPGHSRVTCGGTRRGWSPASSSTRRPS